MTFDKKYDPKEKEAQIRDFWLKNQTYKFNEKSSKVVFSIDTPPPTLSGKMHVGHAFSYSQQDFIARFKRMKGYEVYYPFGTDDNGLATEKLVQKEKKVNLRHVKRDEAINICLDYLKENRDNFIQDWKNIGVSSDFNYYYSTIDEHSRKISQESFLKLFDTGLAYRKEAPVIWDTVFQSAIAQAELEDIEKETFFNDIAFKLETGEELIIATTRPELLCSCVAIFANPEDQRYKHLFGKYAYSPIYNQKVPIIADEGAEMDKGTGIVMCCTFGDQKDVEWYKKHNLELKMGITKDGKMSSLAGKYEGLKIEQARKDIIEDLKEQGLLKNQKKITHAVNVGERSGIPIEIINSKQWYIKYLDRKDDFLNGANELNWNPKHMKSRVDNWIKGLNWDWSISRQRHYGVPIPVWYCKKCEHPKIANKDQLPIDPTQTKPIGVCEKCGHKEFEAESDVFDTWFTSASTPEISTKLVKDKSMQDKIFPMSLRPQAHDIINFWLFYSMAKSRMMNNKLNPWNDVTISGWVLAPDGTKMSKSKNNTISPQDMIQKYSADALRFAASSSKLGQDIPFQEKELVTAIKIINKLYNANKFASMLLEGFNKEDNKFDFANLNSIDQYIIAKAQTIIKQANEHFNEYDYQRARYLFENFFMSDVADNYIEIVKQRLWKKDEAGIGETKKAQRALYYVLYNSLKGLAPFLVYITEEIYQSLYKNYEEQSSIHLTNYPEYNSNYDDKNIIELGNKFVDIIKQVRKFKTDKQLSMKEELAKIKIYCDTQTQKFFKENMYDFTSVTSIKEIEFINRKEFDFEIIN